MALRPTNESGALLELPPSKVGALSIKAHPVLGLYAISGPEGLEIREIQNHRTLHIDLGAWTTTSQWYKSSSKLAATFGRKVIARDCLSDKRWESPEFDATLQDLCWLPQNGMIASTGYGGVNLTAPFRSTAAETLEFKGSLLRIAISPNSRWVVTGSQDCTLQVFSPKEDVRLEMRGYLRKVNELAFNSTGSRLANNGSPEVTVWDFSGAGPKGRKPLQLGQHRPTAIRIKWHPKNELVFATSDARGVVRVFDLNQRQEPNVESWASETNAKICVLEWMPDGSLFCADTSGRCATFSADTSK